MIVSLASPDAAVLGQIRIIDDERPLPIVVFAERSDRDVARTAIQAGISAYVVQGLQAERIAPILETAMARFTEFQNLRRQRDQASTKLAERKCVERAKGILMRRRNVPENVAYQALRRMAMDRGKRIGEVAKNIVTAEEMLAKG